MSLLLRRIEDVRAWTSFPRPAEGGVAEGDIPLWALREFMPTHRDRNGLSVFEVDDEQGAEVIAGAFAFGSEALEGGRTLFAYISDEELRTLGIACVNTPGNLSHLWADDRHREIRVERINELIALATHFFNGEIISIEGRTAAGAAKAAARQNIFQLQHIHTTSFNRNWRAKNLVRFMGENIYEVRGVPLTPAAQVAR